MKLPIFLKMVPNLAVGNQNTTPDNAILTEDEINYLLTEDEQFYLIPE